MAKKKPNKKQRVISKRVNSSMTRKSRVLTATVPGAPIALYRAGTGKIAIGGIDVNFYLLDNGARVADMAAAEAALGFGVDSLMHIAGVPEQLPSAVLAHTRKPLEYRQSESEPPRPCCYAEVIIHLCAATLAVRRANGLPPDKRMFGTFAELLLCDVATRAAALFVDAITGSSLPNMPQPEGGMTSSITQPYFRTYPDEFYDELYRLRGLGPVENYGKHPSYFGNLTNNIVYKRFAPGVLQALKDKSPRDDKGKHRRKLFQMLSPEKQVEMQEQYIPAVIELMKASETFDEFIAKLDARFPIHRRVVRPGRSGGR